MIFLLLFAFDTKTATKVILFLQTKYTSINYFFRGPTGEGKSSSKVQIQFK